VAGEEREIAFAFARSAHFTFYVALVAGGVTGADRRAPRPSKCGKARNVKWLWLPVLAATVGLMVLLQHWGIDQTSSDFVFRAPRLPVPAIAVVDGEGAKTGGIADLHGKFVLLNIWATWCAPCRKELPSLDLLQEQLGGPDFEVVALSVDRDGAEAVKKFYREIGIRRLPVRVAADSNALAALGAYGLPTTPLIDPESKEIGRLVGAARWDSKEMVDFLKLRIAK